MVNSENKKEITRKRTQVDEYEADYRHTCERPACQRRWRVSVAQLPYSFAKFLDVRVPPIPFNTQQITEVHDIQMYRRMRGFGERRGREPNLAAVSANRSLGVEDCRAIIPATTSPTCDARAPITTRRQAVLSVALESPRPLPTSSAFSHSDTSASAAACARTRLLRHRMWSAKSGVASVGGRGKKRGAAGGRVAELLLLVVCLRRPFGAVCRATLSKLLWRCG